MSNLIFQYTYTDDVQITVEFVCGDAPPNHMPPDIVVRCDECIAGDFDCDDVHAVADRMIDEAIEKTYGRFPADHDHVHDGIVIRLMKYRAEAAIKAHDDQG